MSEQTAGLVSGQRTEAAAAPRGLVRGLAWFALAGQAVFIASWIVAGALDPGYSHVESGVSTLAAENAEHPWIVSGGFVVLGLSIAALGPALPAVLQRRRATWVAAALFVVSGACMAAVAALPIECDFSSTVCQDRFEAGDLSWQTTAHIWVSWLFDLAFIGTAFAIGRALWPGPLGATAILAALTGIAIVVISFVFYESVGEDGGLVQRVGWLTTHAWVAIVAIGVLHRTAVARPSELIPVGPRAFLGQTWSGPGGFCLGAFYVERWAQPITFTRTSRWIDDQFWILDDTTRFTSGFAIERRMFGELVGPERVRIVADDMPGGAEIVIEEGGYRVYPYKYSYPIGPVRFNLRCRDEVRKREGGELEWTIRFSWLGIPAGVLRGYVRPVE
jgi:hypothetical membrane protein